MTSVSQSSLIKGDGDGMARRTWLVAGGLVGAGLTMALSGCADAGDLTITNDSASEVVVRTGDQEITVSATGGAVILDYGCTPGDVTVEFASGQRTLLPGPVCPDQQIVIRDDTATLEPAPVPGT